MERVKLICGVGINDADYVVKKTTRYKDCNGAVKSRLLWACPVYTCWKSMIERVHSKSYLEKRPTYLSVDICEEWLRFSNFKTWVDGLGYSITGLVIDKDILNPHKKKVYCPEYCAFVSKTVNSFVLNFGQDRAELVRKRTENCYESRVLDTITKKEILFYSDNYQECRDFSISEKVRIAKELAKSEPDVRIRDRLPKIIEGKYK